MLKFVHNVSVKILSVSVKILSVANCLIFTGQSRQRQERRGRDGT